jgi:hypothetical protein
MSASRTKPGRQDGSKAMFSATALTHNRPRRKAQHAPSRRTQSGLSVCHSQIGLSLWKSEHPHPARPTLAVTTDPWHATHSGHGRDDGVKALAAKAFAVDAQPARLCHQRGCCRSATGLRVGTGPTQTGLQPSRPDDGDAFQGRLCVGRFGWRKFPAPVDFL